MAKLSLNGEVRLENCGRQLRVLCDGSTLRITAANLRTLAAFGGHPFFQDPRMTRLAKWMLDQGILIEIASGQRVIAVLDAGKIHSGGSVLACFQFGNRVKALGLAGLVVAQKFVHKIR